MSAGLTMLGMDAAFDALEAFEDEMTDDTAYVGTTAEYASFVEFGTENQQAQPYLRPALQQGLAPARIEQVLDGVLSGEIDNKAAQIAFEVESIAKNNAPVDTGNLQGSIAAASEENEMRQKSEEGKL
jgi:hypothetical protein